MTVAGAYRRWCYAVLKDVRPPAGMTQDDLAQEMLIAIWKAEGKYDPTKGALPSWATKAAKMRLADLLGHGRATGHQSHRGAVMVEGAISLDLLQDQGWDAGYTPADYLALRAALRQVEEPARRYVWLRFWEGRTEAEIQPLYAHHVGHAWKTKWRPQLRAHLEAA